jgi:hypothetical protein
MRTDQKTQVLTFVILLTQVTFITAGNSRLDYTDRVYLVAQWIKTHLFLDKRQFMYLVTGPNGMVTKEYKMIITTEG